MKYIEVKTIYGEQYKYLRKAVRIGEKVTHVNLKYLSSVESVYKIGKARKTNAPIYV